MSTARDQGALRDLRSACNVRAKWPAVSLSPCADTAYHPGVITAEDPQRTQPVPRAEPTRLTPAPARPARSGWAWMRPRTAALIVAAIAAASAAAGVALSSPPPGTIPSVVPTTAPDPITPDTGTTALTP
jgi:hypothetical protein